MTRSELELLDGIALSESERAILISRIRDKYSVSAIREMRIALERAQTLLSLLTVKQVVEGGDETIQAAGLDPYCINEGLAQGDEKISTYFAELAILLGKSMEGDS